MQINLYKSSKTKKDTPTDDLKTVEFWETTSTGYKSLKITTGDKNMIEYNSGKEAARDVVDLDMSAANIVDWLHYYLDEKYNGTKLGVD